MYLRLDEPWCSDSIALKSVGRCPFGSHWWADGWRRRRKGNWGGKRTDRGEQQKNCSQAGYRRFSGILHDFKYSVLAGISSNLIVNSSTVSLVAVFQSVLSKSPSVQHSFAGTCCNSQPTKSSHARVSSSNSSRIWSAALRGYVLLPSSFDLPSSDTLNSVVSTFKHFYLNLVLQQDRLRLSRLKTELSESVQHYGDLQKVAQCKYSIPPLLIDGASASSSSWTLKRQHKKPQVDSFWLLSSRKSPSAPGPCYLQHRQTTGRWANKATSFFNFFFTAFNDTDTFQFASIVKKKVGGIQVHLKKENIIKNWFISLIQFQKWNFYIW